MNAQGWATGIVKGRATYIAGGHKIVLPEVAKHQAGTLSTIANTLSDDGKAIEQPLFQPGKIIGQVGALSDRYIGNRMCFERPAVVARHQQFQIGLANVKNCDPGGCRRRHRCLTRRLAAQTRNGGDGNQDSAPDRQSEELAEIEKIECR